MTSPYRSIDFKNIPLYPRTGWEVDVSFRDLEAYVKKSVRDDRLDLSPDYQRDHVWTEEQRVRYVEYQLRGGEGGKVLSFNCPGWQSPGEFGPYQILDGLQRLTSALMFMRDELRVFGRLRSEYTGHLRSHVGFKWRMFELPTREAVLQYYLDMNAGGTPHAESEIARVRALLQEERRRTRAM